MKRLLLPFVLSVSVGCTEEEPVPPQERCAAEGLAFFVSGSITTDDQLYPIENKGAELRGKVTDRELLVSLSTIAYGTTPPAILLNFRDNGQTEALLDKMANLTTNTPHTADLIDTVQVPVGAPRRTDLSTFDCALEDQTICAQLAFDSSRDEVVDDTDAKVFHATGGTLTIDAVDNNRSQLRFTFDVELGKNVLSSADTSSGRLSGCVIAKYSSAGAQGWSLR